MVSKSNFILGIKKNISSDQKKMITCTPPFEELSHTCLTVGFRLHSISQLPWLCVVSKSNNQASRDLTFQICANPSFAWWNQHHRHAPRPPATNTQELGPQWQPHVPPCTANSSGTSPRAAMISSCATHPSATRVALLAMSIVDLPTKEIWLSTIEACASMGCLVFWLLLHTLVVIARSCHALKNSCWCHLTSSLHISMPRHQPRKP